MVLKHVPLDVRSCETLPAEKLHEVTAEQRAAQVAASSLGIELVLAAIDNTPTEIEQAIAAFARAPNGGLVLPLARRRAPGDERCAIRQQPRSNRRIGGEPCLFRRSTTGGPMPTLENS